MQSRLQQRQAGGLLRQLQVAGPLVDFYSNDYLGFARSAAIKELVDQGVKLTGSISNGATGSRLLSGNSAYAETLEHELAALYKCEAGLLYNSGYDANVGLLSALPQRGDTVLHDELIHASLIDGIRLSNANRQSFKHNDVEHLIEKLRRVNGRCYVVAESIYSMDGDAAPLPAIAVACREYNAALIVDEAHAVGVFGLGLIQQHNLTNQVFARVVTFGKAMGCHGAIILGSQLLKKYLVNYSRSFIYTTAAPLHQLATISVAHHLLLQNTSEADMLHNHIRLFKSLIASDNKVYKIIASDSPIQCLIIGDVEKTKQVAQRLQQAGFNVRAILSPTVAPGTERLRIILHTFNTAEQITQLCTTLNQLFNEF